MATFTSRIRLEKQDNGANSGTWGTVLNQNVIDLVDDAVAGYTIVSCSSAITLSSNNGSADQARSAILELQGTLTSSVDITIPSVSKIYFVKNNTSGSYPITLKTAATTAKTTVTQGGTGPFICDGTNVFTGADTTGLGLGTAATLDFGTGDANLIPVSSADVRYIPTSTSSTITSNKVFSGTVITSGTNTFTSTTTHSGESIFSAHISATSSATFAGAVGTPIVSLSAATSLALNLSTGNDFAVTLTGATTLLNPSNAKIGQCGTIRVIQDGTGSRTMSYGDAYNFAGGTAPTLSTGAAAVDLLIYKVREVSSVDVASILNLS
jgi:hypothetical protein|tara:strand:- start:16 stop:987 length:972 start_codon:yes stop_codon:yes gene_type:complete